MTDRSFRAPQAAEYREALAAEGNLFEYKVLAVRENLVGDKINTDALQAMLNEHAGLGWRLKSVTSASVAGRLGPGGTSGLVLIFERRAKA
jgi:hypothetical protein